MDFDALKKCCEKKEIVKLVTLEIGKKYIITAVHRINTSVGMTILADIEGNFSTWLPKRFLDSFSEEAVTDFNQNYSGKVYLEVTEIKPIMGKNCAIINIEKC